MSNRKIIVEALDEMTADYSDTYVSTLESVRESIRHSIEELDKTIKLIKPKNAKRAAILEKEKAELESYLASFTDNIARDPLAKHKGFVA